MLRRPAAILALLTGLNLLNYLDRLVVSAVLPRIQTEFSLSNFQGGLLATVFLVGYFLTSPIFGALGDRVPRKGLIAIGVGVWSAATIASGFATGLWSLLAARVMVGVGEASYATLAPTIIDIHGASVVDLAAASLQGETPFGATVFSFTSGYDRGSINSLAPASTPNGRGAFLTSWPSTGGPIPSLTVLATYKYLFRNVRVEPDEAIVFRVADPYPIGVGVRAFVDVLLDGKKYRMYDELLSPAPASGPRWEQQNIDLRNFAGKSVSIDFGADVRENNPTAAWVAFGSPALVRTTR